MTRLRTLLEFSVRTLLALTLSIGIGAAGACVNGKLTPGAEAAIMAGVRIACPEEVAIPALGPALAMACPGEEAALERALQSVTAQAIAGTPAAIVAVAGKPDAGARPVPLVRIDASGLAVHCGWASATSAPQVQLALLQLGVADAGAGADGGAK